MGFGYTLPGMVQVPQHRCDSTGGLRSRAAREKNRRRREKRHSAPINEITMISIDTGANLAPKNGTFHRKKVQTYKFKCPKSTTKSKTTPRSLQSHYACLNPFGTIGLTTAIFFLLDSPVLVALFYMGQPP